MSDSDVLSLAVVQEHDEATRPADFLTSVLTHSNFVGGFLTASIDSDTDRHSSSSSPVGSALFACSNLVTIIINGTPPSSSRSL